MGAINWKRKDSDIVFEGTRGSVKMTLAYGPIAAGEPHALDVDASALAMTGGTGFVGGNFKVTASTAGAGAWLSGIYAQAISSAALAPVHGYVSGAEIECTLSGAQNPPSHCCLALNMSDSTTGSANAEHAYIYLRQYGTEARATNFLWIADHTIGTNNAAVLISSLSSNKDATHKIKILVGSTPMWLLATTTPPSS